MLILKQVKITAMKKIALTFLLPFIGILTQAQTPMGGMLAAVINKTIKETHEIRMQGNFNPFLVTPYTGREETNGMEVLCYYTEELGATEVYHFAKKDGNKLVCINMLLTFFGKDRLYTILDILGGEGEQIDCLGDPDNSYKCFAHYQLKTVTFTGTKPEYYYAIVQVLDDNHVGVFIDTADKKLKN